MRNLRRDANEHVKKLVKDKLASEDDQKRSEAEIQKVTDRHIAEIDQLVTSQRSTRSWQSEMPPRCRRRSFHDHTKTPPDPPSRRHRHGRQWPLGDAALTCRVWRATRRAWMRLRRLREALRRARRQGADGVRFLLGKLEPPGRGGFRPDGTAGGGAGARGAAAEPGGRAHPLRRRSRAVCRKRCGPAWRRPRPRPPAISASCSTSASTMAGAGTSPRRQHS